MEEQKENQQKQKKSIASKILEFIFGTKEQWTIFAEGINEKLDGARNGNVLGLIGPLIIGLMIGFSFWAMIMYVSDGYQYCKIFTSEKVYVNPMTYQYIKDNMSYRWYKDYYETVPADYRVNLNCSVDWGRFISEEKIKIKNLLT